MPRIRIAPAQELALMLQCEGVKGWIGEYRFHNIRLWRFDFAWPGALLAVEVDGGNQMVRRSRRTGKPVVVGRHTKDSDLAKLNAAAILGWRVMRFSPQMVRSGEALTTIKEALGVKP